jgi:sugar phosphate isomerase/epimerase
MVRPTIDRRSFLQTAAAFAAAAALPTRSLRASEDYGGKTIPVALQLYTIGREANADPAAALAKVAQLGYRGVEFAGYFGKDAKTLRKMLDDNGLKCCGSHLGLDLFLKGDNFQKTTDFARTLGCAILTVPGQRNSGKQGWLDAARRFNELADKLKPLGMRIGYHDHPGDFQKIDDETTWDIFFGNTKKEVVMQCDLGHMGTAGVDPVMYLNKYPGRAASVHDKPSAKQKRDLLVGEDELDWPAIFKACETVGGTEWYIVEYDGGSMEKAAKTIETLKKWGKC